MMPWTFVLLALAPTLSLANFLAGRSLAEAGSVFHVVFEKHIPSGSTALSAWTEDRTSLLAYTCQGPLSLSDANLEVKLSDSQGHGELQFNGTTYSIGADAEVTGGITCGQRYTDIHLVVECLVPNNLPLPKPEIG